MFEIENLKKRVSCFKALKTLNLSFLRFKNLRKIKEFI